MRPPTGMLLRLALLLCAGLVGLVVVAGCSDDPPDAGRLPTGTPSATSSSPTPDTPEEQIEATMLSYFDAVNSAFKAGQTGELRQFTAPACPCRDLADDIRDLAEDGGRYEGARYDVEIVDVTNVVGGTGSAEVEAAVPAYKIIDGSGNVKENSKGGLLHTDYSLVQQESGQWLITNSFDLG